VVAIDNLDLEIHAGEIFALIGPNGAGKTTVVNLVTGLLPIDGGKIHFDGADITGRRPHKIAASGLVRTYQHGRLFDRLSVEENIMLGGYAGSGSSPWQAIVQNESFRQREAELRERAWRLIEDFNLTDDAQRTTKDLPYGHRRMVELARALVHRPKLVLMDEPAAGLNSREVVELSNIIHQLRDSGVTIFIIEHNMGMVMSLSTKISVLNFGKRIAVGAPSEIRSNPDVVRAYLGEVE